MQTNEARRWAFALPPLFAVWINTHGGALAGIVLLLVAAIATMSQGFCGRVGPELFRRRIAAPAPAGVITALAISSVASAAALLINPYGFELVRWLAESVTWLRPQIAEWNPVQFNGDHAAFFLCVAIAAAGCRAARVEIRVAEHRVVAVDITSDRSLLAGRFNEHGMWSDPPAPFTDSVDDAIVNAPIVRLVHESIARLPDAARAVVTLRDVQGLSTTEVAELLELSEANVRVILHRSRARIRSEVEASMRAGQK